MVTTDTIEGTVNGRVSYHYDVFADVLYLRLVGEMDTSSIGEENDDGDIELLEEGTDRLIGVTIISWWKRYGRGASLPDSIQAIHQEVAPIAERVGT